MRSHQYIIFYPEGTGQIDSGERVDSSEIAATILEKLLDGKSVAVPNTWDIKYIKLRELKDEETSECPTET